MPREPTMCLPATLSTELRERPVAPKRRQLPRTTTPVGIGRKSTTPAQRLPGFTLSRWSQRRELDNAARVAPMTQTSRSLRASAMPLPLPGLAGLVVLISILRIVILLGWRDGGRPG